MKVEKKTRQARGTDRGRPQYRARFSPPLSPLAHWHCLPLDHRRAATADESHSFPPSLPPAFPFSPISSSRFFVLRQRRSTLSRGENASRTRRSDPSVNPVQKYSSWRTLK